MHEDGARVFVEVGPRAVLTGLTAQILADREHVAVPVDRPGRSGLLQLLHCLAALAAEGVPVRLERLLRERGARRIDLTTRVAGPAPPRPHGSSTAAGLGPPRSRNRRAESLGRRIPNLSRHRPLPVPIQRSNQP